MKPALSGRRALVIGARRTGVAVARHLARQGATVRVSDQSNSGFDDERRLLEPFAIDWCLGREDVALLDGVELVVPSPGVPRTHPLLRAAVQRGLDVIAEIELAFRSLTAPLYAVTGTNGKSTTTELLGRMLGAAGRRPFIGGNLGTPLIDAVGTAIDGAVAEVSSFQLEWVAQLRPVVGVFLNLTDDHLDRYASLAEYGEAKAALFRAQNPEDFAVLSREDRWVWNLRERLRSRVISFGFDPVEYGTFPRDGTIVVRLPQGPGKGREVTLSMTRCRLRGLHNLENVMAAATAALLAGAAPSAVQSAIDQFPGLPHRLELVRDKDGVSYVDDSKGTNVGAVVKSLASMTGPVILLAGGVDKGGSYEPLRPLIRERVKRLILFGEASGAIREALGSETDTVTVANLEEAVARAAEVARAGDTVLLSPGCASFDMFRDYVERGERFRALAEAL